MTGLPASVAAYPDECAAILSWLQGGWVSQDQFDQRSHSWHRSPRWVRLHNFDPDTILLPLNGDPLIAILQELCRHGMVETRGRPYGKVEYRLVDGA